MHTLDNTKDYIRAMVHGTGTSMNRNVFEILDQPPQNNGDFIRIPRGTPNFPYIDIPIYGLYLILSNHQTLTTIGSASLSIPARLICLGGSIANKNHSLLCTGYSGIENVLTFRYEYISDRKSHFDEWKITPPKVMTLLAKKVSGNTLPYTNNIKFNIPEGITGMQDIVDSVHTLKFEYGYKPQQTDKNTWILCKKNNINPIVPPAGYSIEAIYDRGLTPCYNVKFTNGDWGITADGDKIWYIIPNPPTGKIKKLGTTHSEGITEVYMEDGSVYLLSANEEWVHLPVPAIVGQGGQFTYVTFIDGHFRCETNMDAHFIFDYNERRYLMPTENTKHYRFFLLGFDFIQGHCRENEVWFIDMQEKRWHKCDTTAIVKNNDEDKVYTLEAFSRQCLMLTYEDNRYLYNNQGGRISTPGGQNISSLPHHNTFKNELSVDFTDGSKYILNLDSLQWGEVEGGVK